MKVRRLSVISTFAIGLFAATQLGFAQEAPPSQFEHIQGLEPFVGFWETQAPPEVGGGPVTLSCRLTSNRSYLRMQLTMEVEGERETIGTMLFGRDHAKDQVSLWGFWADQQTHGKVEVGEGTAKWSETGAGHDGRKGSANVSMKVEGNELIVDVTDAKRGDDDQPEMHLTFTRSQRRGRGGQ